MKAEIKHNLESNIWKYYTAGIFQSFWFILAINILYWQSFGISYGQIGLFELIGAITIILFEIPTGAVADLISRKLSVIFGILITVAAMLMIGFGSHITIFALAYLVWAIGDTFISGAQPALIYDSLKDLNREKEYLKIQGKYKFLSTITLLIGTFIAPTLFGINIRLPYILLGVCWLISAFFVMSMQEPFREKTSYSVKKHLIQIKEGIHYSINHKMIRWYFMFSVLIGLPMLIYNDLMTQPFYLSIGFDVKHLTILIPIIYGSASFVSSQAHRIEEKIGENKSLALIAGFHAFCFLIMGMFNVPWIIIFVVLLYMSRDFRWVVLDNYVNKHVVSKMRATVLSVGSMLTNIVMAFAYPLGGRFTDAFGLPAILTVFGIFVIVSGVILFITKPRLVTIN